MSSTTDGPTFRPSASTGPRDPAVTVRPRVLRRVGSFTPGQQPTDSSNRLRRTRSLNRGRRASVASVVPGSGPQDAPSSKASQPKLSRHHSLIAVSSSMLSALANGAKGDPRTGSAHGPQAVYDEMMERFQIRRVGRTPSHNSSSSAFRTLSTTGSKGHQQIPSQHEKETSSSHPPTMRSLGRRLSTVLPILAKEDSHHGPPAADSEPSPEKKTPRHHIRSMINFLLAPVHPLSSFNHLRHALIFVVLAIELVLLPWSILNLVHSWDMESRATNHFSAVTEIVLLLDFVLAFRTAILEPDGSLVVGQWEIASRYFRSWFVFDLLSSLPLRFLAPKFADRTWGHIVFEGFVRIPRLVHVLHWLQNVYFTRVLRSGRNSVVTWMSFSRYSHLFRVVGIVSYIMLLAHYMACMWALLSVDNMGQSTSNHSWDEYVRSYYEVLQLLQGQGLPTTTLAQNVFASTSVLVGSIILAVVFGHVAMLVANFNANSTAYQRKMESIFSIMGKLELPVPLRERIHQYYEHLHREYESLDGHVVQFSKELSHTLELEVVLFKYMELIMHIPFWQGCSPDFQKQLALHLQVRVYLPDDFVIRRGEVGDEFYMINRGVCELATNSDSVERSTPPLVTELANRVGQQPQSSLQSGASSASFDGRAMRGHVAGEIIRRLTRGQAFGEIALVMNYERTATCRASTSVEMCVLNRFDFQRVLLRYAQDRHVVLQSIFTAFMERNELQDIPCPLVDLVRSVYQQTLGKHNVQHVSAKFAAERIVRAITPDVDDSTILFGVSNGLRHRLAAIRDEEQPSHAPLGRPVALAMPTAPSAVALTQEIDELKRTNEETVRALQDVREQLAKMTQVLETLANDQRGRNTSFVSTLKDASEENLRNGAGARNVSETEDTPPSTSPKRTLIRMHSMGIPEERRETHWTMSSLSSSLRASKSRVGLSGFTGIRSSHTPADVPPSHPQPSMARRSSTPFADMLFGQPATAIGNAIGPKQTTLNANALSSTSQDSSS